LYKLYVVFKDTFKKVRKQITTSTANLEKNDALYSKILLKKFPVCKMQSGRESKSQQVVGKMVENSTVFSR
jgi:hypothetical protein